MQTADEEIQIFVPGASKRDSNGSTTDTPSHINSSTADVTLASNDANTQVPGSSELQNSILDTSLTPKAASSCADDICSTTLVGEIADAVIAAGDDLEPDSSPAEETYDGFVAGSAGEQTIDVDDDKFFPASEGEL